MFVHKTLRGKGYGSMLLDKVVSFCKSNNIYLECWINPYGDMNMHQLKDFYIRHGFIETNYEGLVVLNFAVFGNTANANKSEKV